MYKRKVSVLETVYLILMTNNNSNDNIKKNSKIERSYIKIQRN
jgi:hypothetical protein